MIVKTSGAPACRDAHPQRPRSGKTMKMIVAYVQPDKVDAVQAALVQAGVVAMTLSPATGCGQQRGRVGIKNHDAEKLHMLAKVRLEIAVRDNLLDTAMEAIVRGARTYHLGDGMIFVYEITDCMRIRTRSRGPVALDQKAAPAPAQAAQASVQAVPR